MMNSGDFDSCFDDVDVDDDDDGMGSRPHLIRPMLKRIQSDRNPLSQNQKKKENKIPIKKDQIRWKSMWVLFGNSCSSPVFGFTMKDRKSVV